MTVEGKQVTKYFVTGFDTEFDTLDEAKEYAAFLEERGKIVEETRRSMWQFEQLLEQAETCSADFLLRRWTVSRSDNGMFVLNTYHNSHDFSFYLGIFDNVLTERDLDATEDGINFLRAYLKLACPKLIERCNKHIEELQAKTYKEFCDEALKDGQAERGCEEGSGEGGTARGGEEGGAV